MLEYLQSCLRAAEMDTAQAAGAVSPVQGLMSEREAAGEAHPQHRELQAANAQLEVRFLIIHERARRGVSSTQRLLECKIMKIPPTLPIGKLVKDGLLLVRFSNPSTGPSLSATGIS